MKTIYIINGPNLNLLGERQPEIYGTQSFDQYLVELKRKFPTTQFHYFQSNHEGRLIDKIQEVGFLKSTGIILNAAGYTHTSIALGDTVAAIKAPVAEVHISDIYSREDFRRHSFIKAHAAHFISGKGLEGYAEAIHLLIKSE